MNYEGHTMEIVTFENKDMVMAASGFDSGSSLWSVNPNRSDK